VLFQSNAELLVEFVSCILSTFQPDLLLAIFRFTARDANKSSLSKFDFAVVCNDNLARS
jgi:hypothetical protein